MSGAGEALVAGVLARLKGAAGLAGAGVFDAPPVRAGLPYAEVGEPVLADWSGTGWTGRDGRIAVALFDGGERPVRARALMAAVEERLDGMPGELAGGWRIVRLRLARSRLARAGERWAGAAEFSVRLVRMDA